MLGYVAIGLAIVAGVVPASPAQDSRLLERCKSAEPGIAAEEQQTQQGPGSGSRVVVVVPTGRVCVGPESVDGEYSYVRRTTAKEGMAVVEVSATPFMPVLASNEGAPVIARTDQPAGW